MSEKSEKQILLDWDEFLDSIRSSTPVDTSESEEAKAARIKQLEADPEAWFAYYFPKYCFASPAPFQKNSTKRFLKAKRIFQRRAWARGLAKSTRRMLEIFFKMFALKCRTNLLLVSKTEDNAIRLLAPYRANLQGNQRLIHDYGVQEKAGNWKDYEFVTRSKSAFRAVGAEQNPRGSKLEEMRVNTIVFDDVDDDEVCRNPERVKERFRWIQKAVMPTVEISGQYAICMDNNIIAEDSCASMAAQYVTDDEIVNIRDENGKSVWPEKNSEQDIDDMLALMSYEAQQAEYFNNPIREGQTFKEMHYGKCPPLKALPFIVIYADPSPSNKDKPLAKSRMQNSCKGVAVMGFQELHYYVYKMFLDNTTNSNFIDWLYAAYDYVYSKCQGAPPPIYVYIENNSLQDPFYQQVLLPLVFEKGKARNDKMVLPITPDDRDKPEKWFRIEGTLEPVNRLGLLILNEEEENNPHMKRLVVQFIGASATSRLLDGPDTIEGGVHIIKLKLALVGDTRKIQTVRRPLNPKRL